MAENNGKDVLEEVRTVKTLIRSIGDKAEDLETAGIQKPEREILGDLHILSALALKKIGVVETILDDEESKGLSKEKENG